MKNFLFFYFFMMSSILYSQSEKQRIEREHTQRLVSNGSYNKALDEMQTSAIKHSEEKIQRLDEQFEWNFLEKDKYKSKLNSLIQKKSGLENKLVRIHSEDEKNNIKEKIGTVNTDIVKLNEKLKSNQNELKNLQELYRNLKEKR